MDQLSDEQYRKMAMEFAASPAGKQLMAALQQNGGDAFQAAMRKAAAGDYAGAKQALSNAMSNPEIRKLIDQFGR